MTCLTSRGPKSIIKWSIFLELGVSEIGDRPRICLTQLGTLVKPVLHPRRLQLDLTSKDRVGSSNTKTWTPFKTTKTNQHHQGKSQLKHEIRGETKKTKHWKNFKSTKLHVKWMKLWSKRRAWYFLRKQNLDPFAGTEQNWWTNRAVVWVAYKKVTKSGNVVSM